MSNDTQPVSMLSSSQKSKSIAAPLSQATFAHDKKKVKHLLRHLRGRHGERPSNALQQTYLATLILIFVLSLFWHSSEAVDDTLYLYEDDLYDTLYYDDDYSSALTKYYQGETQPLAQHQSGE